MVFANTFLEQARALDLRTELDNTNESVGKKIRASEMMKVPYTVVIGEKEITSGQLMPRIRKDMEVQEQHEPLSIEEFLGTVAHEAKARVTKSSM